MWLSLGNLRSQLSNATTEETIWLSDYLAFDDKSAFFRKGANSKIQLYDNVNGMFPAGMTGIVVKGAREKGFDVQFIDQRKNPLAPITGQARDDALYWLRKYQRDAVDIMIDKGRGIIHAPTGAGKTEMAAGLVRAIGGHWLLIVHNKKLMHQAAERYDKREGEWLGGSLPAGTDPDEVADALYNVGASIEPAGRVGDGQWVQGKNFTCCTFQTLARALRKKRGKPENKAKYDKAKALLNSADGVIVDECHVLPADSFWGVLMSADNAYYRIGISGTPLARGDRRSVLAVAALGPVQYRIKPDVLIKAGVLAKPRIRMLPCHQELPDPVCGRCGGSGDQGFGPGSCGPCDGKGIKRPHWQTVQKALLVKSKERNELALHTLVHLAAKPCLVFVEAIEHGQALQGLLDLYDNESGSKLVKSAFVYGKHDTKGRDKAIADLVSGEIDVLIASKIFQEGVDVPPIRSVMIASGGKSIIAAIQKVGRGMRVTKDKTAFDVFDFNDTGHKWTERHTKQRIKAYQQEGYEVVHESAMPLFLARKK